ncbi:MAG: Gfo/Idh/MocA family oxidoreductase [Bacteroidales bacterium]|nr:Gfo/Idh/MocA family oxidoreductase [Bacteroidales bacterium]
MKKLLFILVAVILLVGCVQQPATEPITGMIRTAVPERPEGQTDVLELACEPLSVVRVGFIGLGMRGPSAVERFTHLEGVEIKALCDLYPERVTQTQEILTKAQFPAADEYSGEEGWKALCERDDIDLVYLCTPWLLHTPMAVYAMEHGKHVAIEVPAAITLEECWQLVNTAEKTRRHCMMLENCCYDFFEMATLNMAQNGLFGEVMHVEGAYIHDLRFLNFASEAEGGYQGYWRLKYNAVHTGNPYPTHGLGPICQILNIHRGDKMNYLVSLSSDQKGMTAYATEKFGDTSSMAKTDYALGDMNTTLVRTEKGKSILIQHDVTSPRPYNRHHIISGTKGFAQKYPVEGLAFDPNAHSFMPEDEYKKFMKEWEHPLTKEIGEKAREVGGHGGMDFIMDYRLIYCLRNGLPLDQDVYDAAEWSCISALSEMSVTNGSVPVEIPDFTRGAWNKVKGFRLAEKQ